MAKRSKSKRPSRAKPVKAAGATGPVTLEQAAILARAQLPAPKRGKAVEAAARPDAVGAARKRLAVAERREARRHIQEYKLTMEILKERGVKGLVPRAKSGAPVAKRAAGPLQILAEGDSWFKYPVPLFGGGLIRRLEQRVGVPILNLAKAGDEVRYMLGVEERTELIKLLGDGCPAGGPWDVLLFSGGGNDIVDDPMALWIKDYDPALPPARQIHQPRLDAALALVLAGYEDLISLRDTESPGSHLIFHAYDFAIPDGRGVCHLGPWLAPTFGLRKFPSVQAGSAVVRVMLQQFAAMLAALDSPRRKITVINGQGTLAPQESSWHNELHPSKAGFNAFAEIFHRKLKELFPHRVL